MLDQAECWWKGSATGDTSPGIGARCLSQLRYVATPAAPWLIENLVAGMLIGAECANVTEPYIVGTAISAMYRKATVVTCPWMGRFKPNAPIIDCVKYERRGSDGHALGHAVRRQDRRRLEHVPHLHSGEGGSGK